MVFASSFKPKYKTGVWLEPEEHKKRKAEQKQLQMIRKNEYERNKIVHELVNNIVENIIKTKKEDELNEKLAIMYIRPKKKFQNKKRTET